MERADLKPLPRFQRTGLTRFSFALTAAAALGNGPATTLLASKMTYSSAWTVFAMKYCALTGSKKRSSILPSLFTGEE
jgi:hypothetical protein